MIMMPDAKPPPADPVPTEVTEKSTVDGGDSRLMPPPSVPTDSHDPLADMLAQQQELNDMGGEEFKPAAEGRCENV